MTVLRFSWVFLCVILISIGQILFKYTALDSGKSSGLISLIRNPFLIVAVLVYGVATLLWVWQLKYIPLNRAYPIFALAFVIVPLMSWALFGERINLYYLVGVMFIVLGIVLCVHNY